MAEISKHEPGSFCWPELATSDQDAAKEFYTSVFGWTAEDSEAGPGVTYTMLRLRGKEVGALYRQEREETARGIPPHWNSYVSVVSADETAAKARALGGSVVARPFDVMDAGRMAVLQDPTGAAVCVWQARRHMGARIVGEPSAMCWCELITTDATVAGRFHSQLFGWTLKPSGGSPPYVEFLRGGTPIGGMMEMLPEWGEAPSHWLLYFGVTDCDDTAARARELGGRERLPPKDIPGVGRFAILQDPQGAGFAIIALGLPA